MSVRSRASPATSARCTAHRTAAGCSQPPDTPPTSLGSRTNGTVPACSAGSLGTMRPGVFNEFVEFDAAG
eukprot:5498137-Pyramimonas_sp.AAC.1